MNDKNITEKVRICIICTKDLVYYDLFDGKTGYTDPEYCYLVHGNPNIKEEIRRIKGY